MLEGPPQGPTQSTWDPRHPGLCLESHTQAKNRLFNNVLVPIKSSSSIQRSPWGLQAHGPLSIWETGPVVDQPALAFFESPLPPGKDILLSAPLRPLSSQGTESNLQ